MSAPLDLDAICRRALDAATDEDAYFTRMGVLTDDIPALVAEVRRLRAESGQVKALADAWNETPDYAPSEYDRGRVEQRHDMTAELLAVIDH